jgi:hypothetical protein
MGTAGNNVVQSVISFFGVCGVYAFVFWRMARRRKSKVIAFGGLALGCFFVMAVASRVSNTVPFWAVAALYLLFFLLICLMIFFLGRQGYVALRLRTRRQEQR